MTDVTWQPGHAGTERISHKRGARVDDSGHEAYDRGLSACGDTQRDRLQHGGQASAVRRGEVVQADRPLGGPLRGNVRRVPGRHWSPFNRRNVKKISQITNENTALTATKMYSPMVLCNQAGSGRPHDPTKLWLAEASFRCRPPTLAEAENPKIKQALDTPDGENIGEHQKRRTCRICLRTVRGGAVAICGEMNMRLRLGTGSGGIHVRQASPGRHQSVQC